MFLGHLAWLWERSGAEIPIAVSDAVAFSFFVLAGMLAAIAGYLYGGLIVNFSAASLLAPPSSISVMVMAIFGGITTVTGALLGALWTQGIPYLFGSKWGLLSTGIGVLRASLKPPSPPPTPAGGCAGALWRCGRHLAAGVAWASLPAAAGQASAASTATTTAMRNMHIIPPLSLLLRLRGPACHDSRALRSPTIPHRS